MSKRALLSGNEAIARGAYEAGIHVATAYPGTPSTEILENVAKYKEIYSEWSTNEKVALEVGMGASFGGARTLTAMKHVGVNVAADPLFTFAYTGTDGGFVLVSADDPGMHSSQNEQDNRRYAKFAKWALLEPSDSHECKELVKEAIKVSEKFNTPVLLRLSTRLSHSKGLVELGERDEVERKPYTCDISKRVVLPAHARKLHVKLEERLKKMEEYSNESPFNVIEEGDTKIGIISSGISYQYAKEAFPKAAFLKLGMSFPFPKKLTRKFADMVDKIYVIEENEPFIEEEMLQMGIEVIGKDKVPIAGELSQRRVAEAFDLNLAAPADVKTDDLPARPPVLCPGCPHRGIFYITNKMKLNTTTDIGCYTLGVLPPLNCGETCVCMGASITNAFGLELGQGKEFGKKTVAFIGDSTFMHSGMTGLANVAYNKGNITTALLDNSITAMTGHQEHPGTGKTLMGDDSISTDYVKVAEAVGVKDIHVTDAFDLKDIEKALKATTTKDGPSLVINKGRCILLDYKKIKVTPMAVDSEKCIACGLCLKVGCPALSRDSKTKKAKIDMYLCAGDHCEICKQVCPKDAIGPIEK
ncbi:MAG: indolepyruvate ferredoxin oxidoreductase subunit alpha [Candidatus Zixiibacteriota bacterium]